MAEENVTTDVTTGGANGDGTEVRDTGATPRDEGSGQGKTYTQADFEKALQSETDKRVRQATFEEKWFSDMSYYPTAE